MRRARALLEVDRPADAVPLLERCLAERPDAWVEVEALHLLAVALLALERPQAALDVADRLVGAQPDLSQGHLTRSQALDGLGRTKEALGACASAVRIDPDHWSHHAQYALLVTQVTAASGDAMRAARTACELAPGEPQAHLVRGVVAARQMRHDESQEAYHRVLAIDPGNAAARSNLASSSGWGTGLGDQIEAYSSALGLDPGLAVARDNLERLAVLALRRAYWGSALALVACVAASLQGGAPLRALVGTVALAVLATLAVRLVRRTPVGARTFLLERVRHQPFLRVSALLSVVMVLATLWAAYAPLPEWFVPWVLRPLGFAGIAMLVADVLRRE